MEERSVSPRDDALKAVLSLRVNWARVPALARPLCVVSNFLEPRFRTARSRVKEWEGCGATAERLLALALFLLLAHNYDCGLWEFLGVDTLTAIRP